ncbi:MAG: SIS domain-containing protein [Clostridia bacterium]|nr:SIS domain-containing protein [Clostridia bacterium]
MADLETILKEYTDECTAAVRKSDFAALSRIAEEIVLTKKTGNRIFTAGNGGSAANASHFCNDLTKGCRVYGRNGFIAECLSDSSPVQTCLSNDFSYAEAYEILLRTKAAREIGMKVFGFLGRDGGKMKPLCDECVVAPTDNMEMLEDMHLLYCHALVTAIREKLKVTWDAEIIRPVKDPSFRTALFDFDGTVSLIRRGWQGIMIPYFCEVLREVSKDESDEEIVRVVTDFVDKLTGKQTIFQCMQLDDEVALRGGKRRDPLDYKKEYLRRLGIHIADRKKGLENGTIDPDELTVPGVREFVRALTEKGISCCLASGTDESDVLYEASLLNLDKIFGERIYGAHDKVLQCSKEIVIRDLLKEGNVRPEELVSFGDGYVEIQLVHDIGGYAVGVATDEERREGINEWKRNRLLAAGASMIIPDFSDVSRLISLIT